MTTSAFLKFSAVVTAAKKPAAPPPIIATFIRKKDYRIQIDKLQRKDITDAKLFKYYEKHACERMLLNII